MGTLALVMWLGMVQSNCTWHFVGGDIDVLKCTSPDKWSVLMPAIDVSIPPEQQDRCGPTPCNKDICLAICTAPETTRKGCADKSRILLHAEDGAAWCLATPKEDQP